MSKLCPACESPNVISESHYTQSQLVCIDCGAVVEQGSYENDQNIEGTTRSDNLPKIPVKLRGAGNDERIPVGLTEGKKAIQEISGKFNFSTHMLESTQKLYSDAFSHKVFHFLSLNHKQILAGCCAYIVMRQNEWPVSILEICNHLQSARSDFGRLYAELKRVFQIDVSSADIENIALSMCCKAGLDETVITRAVQIVNLAKEMWITPGRNPCQIIVAAAYLAWQASNPRNHCKKTVPFFLNKYDFIQPRAPLNGRINEMRGIFNNLSKKLPWINIQKKSDLIFHLNDIIDHSNLLVYKSLRTPESNPPSFKMEKSNVDKSGPVVPAITVSHSPELTSNDIPDSELKNFIRNEEEVALYQHFLVTMKEKEKEQNKAKKFKKE